MLINKEVIVKSEPEIYRWQSNWSKVRVDYWKGYSLINWARLIFNPFQFYTIFISNRFKLKVKSLSAENKMSKVLKSNR